MRSELFVSQRFSQGPRLERFRSGKDFASQSNDSFIFHAEQLQTPTAIKSHNTAKGDPGHKNFKNNQALLANDSISSNKTRPSQDHLIGRDQSAIMMAAPGHGMLTLLDNREISPAPVSRFAPKMCGPGNMNHNRVTLPFKRRPEAAGRPVFDKLSLKRAATSTWEENFKLSKKE